MLDNFVSSRDMLGWAQTQNWELSEVIKSHLAAEDCGTAGHSTNLVMSAVPRKSCNLDPR